MRKKKKTLDNYIDIAKTDIYVYLVVTIIFFSYLCYGVYIYKNFFLFFFGFIIIIPFSSREKVKVYKDLKKIKKYLLDNDLLTKIGEIDFWNEESYFLTENYMIVINNGVINHFAYSDIKQMYKKTYHDICWYISLYTKIFTYNIKR